MVAGIRLVVLGAALAIAAVAGPAFGQSDEEQTTLVDVNKPTDCWDNYSECAAAAFGDEGWRSGCYADFTSCLGRQDVGQCPTQETPATCTDYLAQCNEFATGSEDAKIQCGADVDVCKYAHGC